jgi:thiol-disulfide isomerase/thioredoxin
MGKGRKADWVRIGAWLCWVVLALGCARQARDHRPVVLGGLDAEKLFRRLPEWERGYREYQPDSAAVRVLREVQDPVEILVFLGTWCGDSEREVPHFMKALDVAGNRNLSVRYFGVPRNFREADDAAAQYDIQAVPTFLVRKGATEVGRIVERATASIEADLAGILISAGLAGRGR